MTVTDPTAPLRAATPGLLAWYARNGRTHLPWRRTRDPYRIVVSEFMLQQTQVERVLPLYAAFLERFHSFAALAAATQADVVRMWRGLGYNSRAQRLHALARSVVVDHGGVMPREREALLALPGIGPYTASAVRAFAFDADDAALDTNIRRIVQRVSFGLEWPVPQPLARIDEIARAAVPAGGAHDWNSAMMDLGATICGARAPKCLLCPLQAHCAAAPVDPAHVGALARAYAKRSPQEALRFERTTRYLRGRIVDCLRDVPAGDTLDLDEVRARLAPVVDEDRLAEIPVVLVALVREGIAAASAGGFRLRA